MPLEQNIPRVDPGAIGHNVCQCTLEPKLAVALLKVLTGQFARAHVIQIVQKRARVARLTDALLEELARDVAQVFGAA